MTQRMMMFVESESPAQKAPAWIEHVKVVPFGPLLVLSFC